MEEPYELPASRRRKKILSPTRLIVGSFFLVILVGTLLLLLPFSTRDGHIQLVDALFTATSATCVTGLIVFDTYTEFTWFGQLVILLLIQVGGLGLVTLTSVFTVGLRRKVGFKSMKLVSESINTSSVSDAGKMLMMVIRLAFTFELVGALLLAFYFVPHFGPKGLWIAVFLSISSFCNAGFDVLGFLGPYCSLMPIFSLPKTKHLSINAKVVLLFTGVLLALGTLGLLALEWNNPTTIGQLPADEKVLASMFQSVTARTAGYATLNLASLTMFSKYLMILLMFIGAAPGGTGGGVKVTTIGVLAVTVFCVAGGREDPVIFGRRIDKKTVYRSATVILLSLIAVLVSAVTIFFNTDARVTEVDSLFEAVSAYATVGLSTGATVLMNTPAKLITVVTMFIGRVGPVSLLISLARQASEGSRREVLPEARISVG